MTTGSYDRNGQFNALVPIYTGQALVLQTFGPRTIKTWNGGDSTSAEKQKRVTARVTSNAKPPYPDVVNRLPNEDTKAFHRRIKKAKAAFNLALLQWRATLPQKADAIKKKPSKRLMPPHYYNMDKTLTSVSPWSCVQPGVGYYAETPWPADGATHIPLDPADVYSMYAKLQRRAFGSGWHPGITAAESPKAIKMIGDAARQIRLGLVSLVAGNWRGVVRNLGSPTEALYGRARYSYLSFQEGRMSLSQAWLAFQYGWRPLMKDIEDASAFLADQLYGQDHSLNRRVSANKSFQKDQVHAFSGRVGYTKKRTLHHVRYVITDLVVAPASKPPSLVSLAGIAWEVLPYSFVCDWVVPVSGYLAACRTSNLLSGKVVMTTLSHTVYSDVVLRKGIIGYPYAPNISSRYERVSMSRTVTNELNPPLPVGDLSRDSVFSNWRRGANAVALLQNLRFPELDRFGFKKLLGR